MSDTFHWVSPKSIIIIISSLFRLGRQAAINKFAAFTGTVTLAVSIRVAYQVQDRLHHVQNYRPISTNQPRQPAYMDTLTVEALCFVSYRRRPTLHSSDSNLLSVPREFCSSPPTIWNALSLDIRNLPSVSCFRGQLRTFFHNLAFRPSWSQAPPFALQIWRAFVDIVRYTNLLTYVYQNWAIFT